MSPSVVRSNRAVAKKQTKPELRGKTEDAEERLNGDQKQDLDSSPTISRYGRTIKPKSPPSLQAENVQAPKTPKRKSEQTTVEKMNGTIETENESAIKEELPSNDEKRAPVENIESAETSLSKNEEKVESIFSVGQLAWAQVGNYPYWPCVVTIDETEKIYVKQKQRGKGVGVYIHVQYFGDSCRHGWVPAKSMMPFTGIADFMKLAESSNFETKKRNGRQISLYAPAKQIKRKWDVAVEEATEVLPMTNEERTEHFKPKVVKTKYEELLELAIGGKGNKRERWSGTGGPSPKRMKREQGASETDAEMTVKKSEKVQVEDDEKISINLETETPPTPPSSHKDSSDESTIIKKDKVKKRKKDLDGDFELYYERNRDMIEDAQPDATEAEIRTYLEKTWANMSLTLRGKYRSRIKPANGQMKDVEEEDEAIDQEDASSIESELDLKSKKKRKSRGKDRATDQEDESSIESDSKYNKKPKPSRKKKSLNEARKKEATTDQEGESSVDSESRFKKSKSKSDEPRVSDTAKKSRPYNLFRGMKQERVCQICERTGDLTRCKGPCYSYFHLSCVKPGESSSECSMDEDGTDDDLFEDSKPMKKSINNKEDEKSEEVLEDETFKCIDCLSGVAPACFICNEREDDRLRCSASACGKHYHQVCLKTWPQSHWQGDRLTCPYHMCHTCNSDNPQNGISWSSNEKLVRCVRCPSAYHASTSCLPAGSEILTGSQIVCPKHYKASGPPVNATWCFLCTQGGSLICCDTCPTSFHPECLGINAPDGAFICEDCETGRMPLYGEVVWVKLGHYRWWPSRICFPHEIPGNLEAIQHHSGEFCVMFLGTNNYYWVHRGRAFLYQEGDAITNVTGRKRNADAAYYQALEEANEIHERLKMERVAAKDSESRVLRPPPYVKLKVNKPVGNVKPAEVENIGACDCDPNWEHPCAPDTDCLNRILSVECSPAICPAGPKCNNQDFVRRQYPAMEPFHTVGRGWGLRTLEPIADGKFVVEYVGEVIDEAEYKRRLHHKKEIKNENFYFLTIDQSRMIDAEPKGNLSRFMNHSCMPNCETQKWTVNGDTRIGLFALRDIEVGEELTFNYNLACDGETRKPCLCGAPNCSGFIGLKAQKQKAEEDKKVPKDDGTATEKSLKNDKNSKSEKVDRSLKSEKTPKSEKLDNFKSDKVDRSLKSEKTSKSEKLDNSKSEKVDRSSKSEKTPKYEKLDKWLKSDKGEKTPKSDKIVRTKRSKKIPGCWSCGETLVESEDNLQCSQKTCSKKYHRNCVTLEMEDSKFSCPWHFCKECGKRTAAHCTFCITAYCQVHLDGNLVEYKEKTAYVCKEHEGMESRKSLNEDEDKEETDNEAETDKDYSSISSDSIVLTEKTSLPRESSPRVAIVEVQFSSEEGEESQKEDSKIMNESYEDLAIETKKKRSPRNKLSERRSKRNRRREERIETLRSLTPSQLEIIIGGTIISENDPED